MQREYMESALQNWKVGLRLTSKGYFAVLIRMKQERRTYDPPGVLTYEQPLATSLRIQRARKHFEIQNGTKTASLCSRVERSHVKFPYS